MVEERKYNMNRMESMEVMQAINASDGAKGVDYDLRKCSFEPQNHLINLESDPNRKPRLYLTVEWRVYWLQLWCKENGKGFLIEEQPVEPVPGTSFIQSRCSVYIDGEPAGHGIGGINLNGSKGGDYCIQSCATIAKGRALANAGFGSVFSSALDSENGAEIPCDGGMGTDFFVFTPQQLGPTAGNAAFSQVPNSNPEVKFAAALQSSAPAFAPDFPEQPSRRATVIPESGNAPRTREEALQYTVPMKGEWFGHPLGEVLAKSPKDVQFYASCRNADLKAAAKLVLSR